MDHSEGVVLDFLRADRRLFINAQCCIQLNPGSNPDTSGPHLYCDAVAVSVRDRTAYLCEISYAGRLPALLARLKSWDQLLKCRYIGEFTNVTAGAGHKCLSSLACLHLMSFV